MDEMKWNKMKDNYANFYYISDSGANWFQWLNSRQDFVEFHFCFSNDSNIFLFYVGKKKNIVVILWIDNFFREHRFLSVMSGTNQMEKLVGWNYSQLSLV
jgi:hypothetical protein